MNSTVRIIALSVLPSVTPILLIIGFTIAIVYLPCIKLAPMSGYPYQGLNRKGHARCQRQPVFLLQPRKSIFFSSS
jgi:hypothetical protein